MIKAPLCLHKLYPSATGSAHTSIKWLLLFSVFISLLFILLPHTHLTAKDMDASRVISGSVCDDQGIITGALVRIQTTVYSTTTGNDGKFQLELPRSLKPPVKLTAWAKGYYIGGPDDAAPGAAEVKIQLKRHNRWDNPEYKWLPSSQSHGQGENQGCAECHYRGEKDSGPMLPVDEWLKDAHSQSAKNQIFLTMHSGKDVLGRVNQSTRYRYNDELRLVPLPPNPDEPYYGPGYMMDNANFTGNCGACHLPLTAVSAPLNTYPESVRGVDTEGINCDFCHKVYDVNLEPDTGLPSPDKPGVLSYEFRRPHDGHQLFVGPLDDIAPGEDTYSAIQKESRFCAPCHFGVFEETVVYNSFGEWLQSPYSKKDTGKSCQDCHMPHSGAQYFAHPEKGGFKRDTDTIVSHRMPGTRDVDLLQNAVTLVLTAEQSPDGILVKTRVSNYFTGHHVPTDTPLRHMMLVVRAYDNSNTLLTLKAGQVLPEYCGMGDPESGCYAGLPGKVFIKLLEEKWTKITPAAAYWRATNVVMDTRIPALESDTSEFLFKAPGSGDVRIDAILIYRRAYKKLLEQKGIKEPDIVMESERVTLKSLLK